MPMTYTVRFNGGTRVRTPSNANLQWYFDLALKKGTILTYAAVSLNDTPRSEGKAEHYRIFGDLCSLIVRIRFWAAKHISPTCMPVRWLALESSEDNSSQK